MQYWYIIHPKEDNIFLTEVPKIARINTNGSYLMFKTLKDFNLIDLPVNYLSSSEIIYKFKNHYEGDKNPILEASSDKNMIKFDCTSRSNKTLLLSNLDRKKTPLSRGLEIVARQLNIVMNEFI